jgi:hypothetical protein
MWPGALKAEVRSPLPPAGNALATGLLYGLSRRKGLLRPPASAFRMRPNRRTVPE